MCEPATSREQWFNLLVTAGYKPDLLEGLPTDVLGMLVRLEKACPPPPSEDSTTSEC